MAAPELIAKLFAARTAAHFEHLKTNSFAAHKALDGFYSDLVDLVDAFAETYQGIFGLIRSYPAMSLPSGAPDKWIEALRKWMKSSRQECCKGMTELENIHDEIMALCASTVYKLRYLDNPALAASKEVESPQEEAAEGGNYLKMKDW